ncbi:MAG TPA: hypothetical protein VD905_09385 [Flavobacteriales bacterium]|nr:hypothetical protein [Flavobacteriales bacterium]
MNTKEIQLHILLGCADARDLNQLQIDAVGHVTAEFRKKGIDPELQVIRSAGSFASYDVIQDIKRIIEDHQKSLRSVEVPVSYYVHIQTHGHLTKDSSSHYISHVHDLKVEDNSPLNCGMLGASAVGVEIEKLLVENQPEFEIKGRKIKIDSDTKIRDVLKTAYAYDGYMAGDWIRSIDLLRTHPRKQRTILEKAISKDSILNTLNIKITAGIQDYALHALIRVDDGIPAVPYWDEIHQYIRQCTNSMAREESAALLKQVEKQKPFAGLISMADPKKASRTYAAQWYLKRKGIETNGEYLPNTVFNITGASFDIPSAPFGPYVIGGFYYAVHYLGLTDQMVMGYDTEQTNRILKKLENDPLMNFIIKKFNVNLIPVNHVDVRPQQ